MHTGPSGHTPCTKTTTRWPAAAAINARRRCRVAAVVGAGTITSHRPTRRSPAPLAPGRTDAPEGDVWPGPRMASAASAAATAASGSGTTRTGASRPPPSGPNRPTQPGSAGPSGSSVSSRARPAGTSTCRSGSRVRATRISPRNTSTLPGPSMPIPFAPHTPAPPRSRHSPPDQLAEVAPTGGAAGAAQSSTTGRPSRVPTSSGHHSRRSREPPGRGPRCAASGDSAP